MDDSGSSSGFFSRLFKRHENETAEDEIASILSEGQDQGTIRESEAEMITNIFELDDIEASEIMTHRKNIKGIDSSWTLEEAMRFICSERYSRFPVYEDSIDNIIGVLHIRDAVRYFMDSVNHETRIKDIKGLLQKAQFIPETSKIDSIFRKMQAEKNHMQIVVDEYGQTSGIVAMEDIIEEIVGNIFDEHDVVEVNVTANGDNVFTVKGLTPLSEVSDATGVDFDDDDNDTLNGYLISRLDRIPEDDVGTEITVGNVKYVILKVEDKTIAEVRMEVSETPDNIEE